MWCDWQDDIRARAKLRLAQTPKGNWIRRLRYWALAMALVLHLGLLVGLRNAMRVQQPQRQTMLQVVFLDTRAPPPVPRPPRMPGRVLAPASHRHTAHIPVPQSTSPASTATSNEPAAPRLQLFNRNGTIWQPARAIASIPTSRERAEELLQRGHNILHCRPTRFTQSYRYDESVGDRIARKYLAW
ncbi:MAG: hypothetical protein WBV39_13525, partial [Rudaea sp.]